MNTALKRFGNTFLAALVLIFLAAPSEGALITGHLDFSGDGVLVNNFGIDWLPASALNGSIPPTTTGDFRYQGPGRTGSFSVIPPTVGLLLGTVRDLPSGLGSGPLGANSLDNFLAFLAAFAPLDGANFRLEELFQGNLAPNNPIILIQQGANVFAGIGGQGRIIDANGDTTFWTVQFSTQFVNRTVQSVVDEAQSTGIQASWSGSLDAQVPEPTTFGLVGGVLLLAGLARRRFVVR